jgi:hypothetical protein
MDVLGRYRLWGRVAQQPRVIDSQRRDDENVVAICSKRKDAEMIVAALNQRGAVDPEHARLLDVIDRCRESAGLQPSPDGPSGDVTNLLHRGDIARREIGT